MIVAPIVTGLIWKFLFDSEVGGIIQILRIFGIQHFNLLNNASTALWGIIIADAWQWTPFVFLVITAGLQNLPLEVYEAAKVDGARGIRMFFYIILPQLRFVIFVAVLFRSIDLFKFFDKIYIMTGGGPGSVTTTLGYYVYKQGFMFFNGSFAAASAFALLFITIVTCQAMIRLMSKVK
jgi:multiple sugar transport system permease protein